MPSSSTTQHEVLTTIRLQSRLSRSPCANPQQVESGKRKNTAKKRAAPMSLSYLRNKQGFNSATQAATMSQQASFSSYFNSHQSPSCSASNTSSISSQCHPTGLTKHDDTIDRTVAAIKLQTDSSKRLKKQSSKSRPFSEKELANLSDSVRDSQEY